MLKAQFFNSFTFDNNAIIHQEIHIVLVCNLFAVVVYQKIILLNIRYLSFVQ